MLYILMKLSKAASLLLLMLGVSHNTKYKPQSLNSNCSEWFLKSCVLLKRGVLLLHCGQPDKRATNPTDLHWRLDPYITSDHNIIETWMWTLLGKKPPQLHSNTLATAFSSGRSVKVNCCFVCLCLYFSLRWVVWL